MHPYNPPDLFLPQYVPNDVSSITLCATFGSLVVAVVSSNWMFLGKGLSATDKGIASWFLVCGLMHILFEGYFITYHSTLQARTDLPAQLWKEYALSDSRYLFGDIFVLAIENITVFIWGPICLFTAVAIGKTSSYRHPLQLLASSAHIYGCLLYFVTSWFEGNRYCRSEPFYFWVYYIGMNVPWIIVPGLLMFQSFTQIIKALKKVQEIETRQAT